MEITTLESFHTRLFSSPFWNHIKYRVALFQVDVPSCERNRRGDWGLIGSGPTRAFGSQENSNFPGNLKYGKIILTFGVIFDLGKFGSMGSTFHDIKESKFHDTYNIYFLNLLKHNESTIASTRLEPTPIHEARTHSHHPCGSVNRDTGCHYNKVNDKTLSEFIVDDLGDETFEDGSDEYEDDQFESVCAISDNGGEMICYHAKP
nr:protein ENHANCED DOWNY MILDEW 2 isoform X1 [Ipomoea batatas]